MKAYFLYLPHKGEPRLIDGIETKNDNGNPYIALPEIEGLPKKKFKVFMHRTKPAVIEPNRKIYNIFFHLFGQKFSERDAFLTACKPIKNTDKVVILTSYRWPEININHVQGKPNGFVPGVQIMNHADIVSFEWRNNIYYLENYGGDPVLVGSLNKTKSRLIERKNNSLREELLKRGVQL